MDEQFQFHSGTHVVISSMCLQSRVKKKKMKCQSKNDWDCNYSDKMALAQDAAM